MRGERERAHLGPLHHLAVTAPVQRSGKYRWTGASESSGPAGVTASRRSRTPQTAGGRSAPGRSRGRSARPRSVGFPVGGRCVRSVGPSAVGADCHLVVRRPAAVGGAAGHRRARRGSSNAARGGRRRGLAHRSRPLPADRLCSHVRGTPVAVRAAPATSAIRGAAPAAPSRSVPFPARLRTSAGDSHSVWPAAVVGGAERRGPAGRVVPLPPAGCGGAATRRRPLISRRARSHDKPAPKTHKNLRFSSYYYGILRRTSAQSRLASAAVVFVAKVSRKKAWLRVKALGLKVAG